MVEAQPQGGSWLQGAVLDEGHHRDLLAADAIPANWSVEGRLVLVSHSCDIAARSFDAEPVVEVLYARILERLNGNFTFGKSPRQLHLSCEIDGGVELLAFNTHERVFLDRLRFLEREASSLRLDPDSTDTLARWLGKRYWRTAFADAFNARLRGPMDSIRDLLKEKGDVLEGLYLAVTDEELGPEETYQFGLVASMRDESYRDPEQRTAAQEVMTALEGFIEATDGLALVERADLFSEADISLDDLRYLRRWDHHDDLTVRDPNAELPPDP